MNTSTQFRESHIIVHGRSNMCDQVSSRPTHKSRAEDLVGALFASNFIETVFRFTKRSVKMREVPAVSVVLYAPRLEFLLGLSHMGEFWIRICAIGNQELTFLFGPEKQCIAYNCSGL